MRLAAPKRLPPAIANDQDSKWMDTERGPVGDRRHALLQHGVGQQLNDDHPDRGIGSGAPEGAQDGERAGGPGPEVRDVGG